MVPDTHSANDYAILQRTKHELRLKVKPGTAARGSVEGGWWPWSTDPAAEFPALVMALSSWVGPARTISYHRGDWDATEDMLIVEGWTVRLEASPATPANTVVPPNTVVLTGSNLRQIRLLVVPPGTPGGVARAVLRSASRSDTVASVHDILASSGVSVDERQSHR